LGVVLSVITGLSGGIIVGAALCAFYIALGVFSKLARNCTEGQRKSTQVSAFLGIVYGVTQYLFEWEIPLGIPLEIVFGLCSGLFLGIYIALLEEVVHTIPFMRRLNMTKKLISIVLIAFALGKIAGSLYYNLILKI